MSVIKYIDCYQGHPVPKTAIRPQGPFPPELFREPEIINEYEPKQDTQAIQDNLTGSRWLRCYDCDASVREEDAPYHECEYDD